MSRTARIQRDTKETKILVDLNIDGSGQSHIKTGIPFFDHMLTLFAKHSLCDLTLECDGDLEIDFHHTVEDCGIALGQALSKALGDKRGIRRYGWALLPMDEARVQVALDFSGRPVLVYEADLLIQNVARLRWLCALLQYGAPAHSRPLAFL